MLRPNKKKKTFIFSVLGKIVCVSKDKVWIIFTKVSTALFKECNKIDMIHECL